MRTPFSSRGPGRLPLPRRQVAAAGAVLGGAVLAAAFALPAAPAAAAEGQAQNTETIAVGEPAPDFELRDAGGESYRLSELTAKGPVVLEFFRSGGW